MTDQQVGEYARFAESLGARELSEPVRVFLLAMRDHQLRANLTQAALAERAAALEVAREGPLPSGRAAVGHDKNGTFSARRLSDELAGRGRLPRAVLTVAVAEAYARRSGEPPAVVARRLETLRAAAEQSAASDKATAQERALASGTRFPTHAELKSARAERDDARQRLDALQATLATVQGRFTELSTLDLKRSETIGVQQQRITELLEQTEALRTQIAERDQALATAESRNRDLDTTALRLRAQVDQLAAEVEELREAVAQRGGVRQDPRPDSSTALHQVASSGRITQPEASRFGSGHRPSEAAVRRPGPPLFAGVSNDLVDDVINDLQRGRLYRPREGQQAAPARVVIEVWATAVRHLESPMREPLDEWDSRWGGLNTWFYGARISLFLGMMRWLLLLRTPVLCAAVVVAATKAPTTRINLPGAESVLTRWVLFAVVAASVAALLTQHLLRLIPNALLDRSRVVFDMSLTAAAALGLGWPIALLVFSFASPASWLDLPELGTAWVRWTPALAVLISVVVLSSHATFRRMMPATWVAALCGTALSIGWWMPGWPGPPGERGSLAGWIELVTVAALVCLGLGTWRHQEQFFYSVANRVPNLPANPQLAARLNQAVRFERREIPTSSAPSAITVAAHSPELGAAQHPFLVTMDAPDRVSVTYRGHALESVTESRPVSQPPSFLKHRPPAVSPEQLECRRAGPTGVSQPWFGYNRYPRTRDELRERILLEELWLCDEGDVVRAGDPLGVSAVARRERSTRRGSRWITLHWTFAEYDGIVVQLTPRAPSLIDRPGRALIRPTSYPFGPVPALERKNTVATSLSL